MQRNAVADGNKGADRELALRAKTGKRCCTDANGTGWQWRCRQRTATAKDG